MILIWNNKKYKLGDKKITCGRLPSNNICIKNDLAVSSNHFIIEKDLTLIDQNSTNGTYINQNKLSNNEQYKLINGDVIELGSQIMYIKNLDINDNNDKVFDQDLDEKLKNIQQIHEFPTTNNQSKSLTLSLTHNFSKKGKKLINKRRNDLIKNKFNDDNHELYQEYLARVEQLENKLAATTYQLLYVGRDEIEWMKRIENQAIEKYKREIEQKTKRRRRRRRT